MELKYDNVDVEVIFARYANDRLALRLEDIEQGFCYTVLTKNLVDEKLTNPNCAFIDINNNGERAENWLVNKGFGKFTGKLGHSGYCIYPEFEFKEELVKDVPHFEQKIRPEEFIPMR